MLSILYAPTFTSLPEIALHYGLGHGNRMDLVSQSRPFPTRLRIVGRRTRGGSRIAALISTDRKLVDNGKPSVRLDVSAIDTGFSLESLRRGNRGREARRR